MEPIRASQSLKYQQKLKGNKTLILEMMAAIVNTEWGSGGNMRGTARKKSQIFCLDYQIRLNIICFEKLHLYYFRVEIDKMSFTPLYLALKIIGRPY